MRKPPVILPPHDRTCRLLADVLSFLKRKDVDLLEVHRRSHLPFYWLRKLRSGEIRSPSVNRIVYLKHYIDSIHQ